MTLLSMMFTMPVPFQFVLKELPFSSGGLGHLLSSDVKGLSVRAGW